MSIISTIGRIAREYQAARSRYLTERALSHLPLELQKDIGWPDTEQTARSNKTRVSAWSH